MQPATFNMEAPSPSLADHCENMVRSLRACMGIYAILWQYSRRTHPGAAAVHLQTAIRYRDEAAGYSAKAHARHHSLRPEE